MMKGQTTEETPTVIIALSEWTHHGGSVNSEERAVSYYYLTVRYLTWKSTFIPCRSTRYTEKALYHIMSTNTL